MQKVFYFGVLVLFSFLTACTTSSNPIDISLSETKIEKTGLATNPVVMNLRLTNRNYQDVVIHWDRVERQSVTGWTYELNGNTSNSGTFNVPANSSVNIILSILPNGNAGIGSGDIQFYDPAHQQMTSKTFHYKLTALNEYFRLNLENSANATNYISSSSSSYSHIHHVWVVNDNPVPVRVQWARTKESTIPSPWIIYSKTHKICYGPSVMTDELENIPPMDSVPFKLIFDHNNSSGYGRTTPIFWVKSDSINSVKVQPFTYEVLP